MVVEAGVVVWVVWVVSFTLFAVVVQNDPRSKAKPSLAPKLFFSLYFSLLLVFLLLSLIFLVGFLCRERLRCLVGFAEEKGFINANCAMEMPP